MKKFAILFILFSACFSLTSCDGFLNDDDASEICASLGTWHQTGTSTYLFYATSGDSLSVGKYLEPLNLTTSVASTIYDGMRGIVYYYSNYKVKDERTFQVTLYDIDVVLNTDLKVTSQIDTLGTDGLDISHYEIVYDQSSRCYFLDFEMYIHTSGYVPHSIFVADDLTDEEVTDGYYNLYVKHRSDNDGDGALNVSGYVSTRLRFGYNPEYKGVRLHHLSQFEGKKPVYYDVKFPTVK